mgnify:CR=1 FL=1
MYDNIIYDFDGTVADSYPYFTRALKLTLEHYGKEDTYESILANLKISVRHALRHYAFPDRAEAKKMMYDIYHRLALAEQLFACRPRDSRKPFERYKILLHTRRHYRNGRNMA